MHAGLVCSTFLPGLVRRLRPLLAPLSLLDTCACVGASLSLNAAAARSSVGAMVLLPASIHLPITLSACSWLWLSRAKDGSRASAMGSICGMWLRLAARLMLEMLPTADCLQYSSVITIAVNRITECPCMLTWVWGQIVCIQAHAWLCIAS